MPLSPQSKRLVGLLALLIVMSVAAVCLWWKPSTQPSADAGQQVVEAFLQKIREGHPDQAWDSTTAEFKSAQGKESFVRSVEDIEFLKQPMRFFAVQTVTVQNQPRSEYLFRAPDGNAKTNIRVVIGAEGSEWKVDLWVLPTAK